MQHYFKEFRLNMKIINTHMKMCHKVWQELGYSDMGAA